MQRPRWTHQPSASTRGRILTYLCSSSRRVADLAELLGISAHATRTHLAALEQEGFVEHTDVRQGVGKPAHLYELTLEGRSLLSKAYQPVLGGILDVLGDRINVEELEALLREAGRRMVAHEGDHGESLRERVEAGVVVLEHLGSLARIEEHESTIRIRGDCCPLASIVPDHPKLCKFVEAMLAEVTGVPVQECCYKGVPPNCCFEIATAGSA